jgi:hypothetical protein
MVQIFVMGDSVMCTGSDGEEEGPNRDASVDPNANPAVNPAANSAPKKKKSRAKKGSYVRALREQILTDNGIDFEVLTQPEIPDYFDETEKLRLSQMSLEDLDTDPVYKASYLYVPSKRPCANNYAACANPSSEASSACRCFCGPSSPTGEIPITLKGPIEASSDSRKHPSQLLV